MDLGTKVVVAIGALTVGVKSLEGLVCAICSLVKKINLLDKEVTVLFKKKLVRNIRCFFKKVFSVAYNILFKKISVVALLSTVLKKMKSVSHISGYLLEKNIGVFNTLLNILKKLGEVMVTFIFKNTFLREVYALFKKTLGVLINVSLTNFKKISKVDTLLVLEKKVTDVTGNIFKKSSQLVTTNFLKKSSLFTGELDILKKASFVAATSGEYENLRVVCARCCSASQR